MVINWVKLSEIVTEAFFQAIVTIIGLYFAFLLGKRASDREWNRQQILIQVDELRLLLEIVDDLRNIKHEWLFSGQEEELVMIYVTRKESLEPKIPKLYGILTTLGKSNPKIKMIIEKLLSAKDDTLTDIFLLESWQLIINTLEQLEKKI